MSHSLGDYILGSMYSVGRCYVLTNEGDCHQNATQNPSQIIHSMFIKKLFYKGYENRAFTAVFSWIKLCSVYCWCKVLFLSFSLSANRWVTLQCMWPVTMATWRWWTSFCRIAPRSTQKQRYAVKLWPLNVCIAYSMFYFILMFFKKFLTNWML